MLVGVAAVGAAGAVVGIGTYRGDRGLGKKLGWW